MKVVIATRNAGKMAEFRRLAADLKLEFCSLDDFPKAPEPEETGTTFHDNALIKARSAMKATGLWSLADDSGLCVDALGGAPGIHSARYTKGSDQARWEKLLNEMGGVPDAKRQAAFVCNLALIAPTGHEIVVEGRCEGTIGRKPVGDAGFGYDPVFIVGADDRHRTMAQLPDGEKDAVSHRGLAFAKMRPFLLALTHPESESWLNHVLKRTADSVSGMAGAIGEEIRQTGELGVLLAKSAGGETLTDKEKHKVREQLIDLAKVVPSLAIFAAPGGMLLLPLAMKLLPFDIRPSAFQHMSHSTTLPPKNKE